MKTKIVVIPVKVRIKYEKGYEKQALKIAKDNLRNGIVTWGLNYSTEPIGIKK